MKQRTFRPRVAMAIILAFFAGTGQGVPIACQVQDANPDPARLRLEYQTADKIWQVLAPSPNDPSMFWLTGPVTKETVVRATATDRAGNSTVRVVTLDTASAVSA